MSQKKLLKPGHRRTATNTKSHEIRNMLRAKSIEIETHKQKNDRLGTQNIKLSKENMQLQMDLDKLRENNIDLNRKCKSLQDKINQLTNNNIKLNKQKNNIQQKMNQMEMDIKKQQLNVVKQYPKLEAKMDKNVEAYQNRMKNALNTSENIILKHENDIKTMNDINNDINGNNSVILLKSYKLALIEWKKHQKRLNDTEQKTQELCECMDIIGVRFCILYMCTYINLYIFTYIKDEKR